MAVEVDDGRLFGLVRRRVRKQLMHTANGLLFNQRRPSLFKWNCFSQTGQKDCFDGLARKGLREG